jgi:hypothetical protein
MVATMAVGVLHETASGITLPASLVEAAWQTSTLDQFYARGEFLLKNILSAGGYHPPGFFHEHTLSKIAALTIGYERRIVASRFGRHQRRRRRHGLRARRHPRRQLRHAVLRPPLRPLRLP